MPDVGSTCHFRSTMKGEKSLLICLKFYLFIHLFLAVLGFLCFMGFSLVMASGGCSLVANHWLLTVERRLWGAGFSSCSSQALGHELKGCCPWL